MENKQQFVILKPNPINKEQLIVRKTSCIYDKDWP